MARKLFSLSFGCKHEFSWPRRSPEGDYYQVCVRCGAEYSYDWTTMQRTRRVPENTHATKVPARACSGKTGLWRPRARRLPVQLEARYRQPGADWQQGTVRNVSQSGVLLEGQAMIGVGMPLEIIFYMPAEICGQPHRRVICSSSVVRLDEENGRMAASISDYAYMTQPAA